MATKREARLAIEDALRIFEDRVGFKVGVSVVRLNESADGWGLRVNFPVPPRADVVVPKDVNGVPTEHVVRSYSQMY
jgi:hypothetical protein